MEVAGDLVDQNAPSLRSSKRPGCFTHVPSIRSATFSDRFLASVTFSVSSWARNVPESSDLDVAIVDVTLLLAGHAADLLRHLLDGTGLDQGVEQHGLRDGLGAVELKLLPAPSTTTASPWSGAIANEAW